MYIIYVMRKQMRKQQRPKESYLSILQRLIVKGMARDIAERMAFDIKMGRRQEA